MLIVGDTIAWIGEDTAAAVHRDAADVVINLDGAFVAPGFVDAHVHATSTGLMITGLDLTAARSREELLDRLRVEADHVRGSWGPDAVVLGHGWDESRWDDPALPTRQDIDAAAGGAQVYLSRIDVHSALVSTSLVEGTQEADAMAGWHPTHSVSQQAHISLRAHALTLMNDPFVRGLAESLADRVVAEEALETDAARISCMFELALNRPPSGQESALLQHYNDEEAAKKLSEFIMDSRQEKIKESIRRKIQK